MRTMNKTRAGSATGLVALLMCCFLSGIPTASALEPGDMAPPLALPGLRPEDGAAVSTLESYRGKVVYIDFWASWCPPCLVSIPLLNELRNRYVEAGADFEIVAVNLDSDPEDGIDFLLDDPVQYRVLHDANGAAPTAYEVKGMPSSYLVDKQGTIRLVHEGFKRSDIDMIEAQIRLLLEEN
jgi:thiol-disulfide isomerase/thioredoxin